MSVHSVKYYDVERTLSRLAMNYERERSLLPPSSAASQTRLDRMRDYSYALSARTQYTRPGRVNMMALTHRSSPPSSPVPSVFKGKQKEKKKVAKSMSTDIYCSPCSRDNLHREATGYCIECSEYFCDSCIKHHRNLKITKNHTLQDRHKMPKVQNYHAEDEEIVEICDKHPTELIRYFCKDHDEPSCAICATLKHRACTNLQYIPDIKSKETNRSCLNTIKHMNSLVAQFESARVETEKVIKAIDVTKEDFEQRMIKLHQDFLDHLQKLEQEAISNMESLYEDQRGYITSRVGSCTEAIKTLQQGTKNLEAAKKNGIESKVFLQMKKINKQVKFYENLLNEVQGKNKNAMTFKFKADAKVKEFLKTSDSIGSIQILQSPGKTFTSLTHFKITSRTDTYEVCDVTGSCFLPDGRIILADMHNESLKVADTSFNMVTQTKLSSEPWDVCSVSNNNQIVVSLPNERKLQFFIIGATIQPLRKIGNTAGLKSSQYYGVAFHNDRIYVTCPKDDPPNVKILDMQGAILQQYTQNLQEQNVFSDPLYITITCDGKTIYVSDSGNKSIITIDPKTETKHTTHPLADENLPGGIISLHEGEVLTCGFKSNSVLQMNADGKFVEDAVSSQGGLILPQSVSYCSQGRLLLVTMQKNSLVKVFQVT
ncbi:uncharacterized protein LOC128243224 [Mya arenaria]|uniref:uncharacterized protein LOC128243224 n=1 Tax=Mya arenaria TaxID=6604 RepID=UPI0022E0F622|nr:uncharacterized protein LOC128243224 [Mya arenaria]